MSGRLYTGCDVAFDHAAAVAIDDSGPVWSDAVIVSKRRKGETRGQRIARGRLLHAAVADGIPAGSRVLVELWPEKIPHNQHQAPAVAAGAWWITWAEDRGLIASYVDIMDWRTAIWWKAVIAGCSDFKALAIETVTSWGWADALGLDRFGKDRRGDLAEAALIAEAGRRRGW